MNKDLIENWDLRNENFDKNVLFATIMSRYGDMPVLETNPLIFKYQADIWWAKRYRTFEKWFNAFDIPYSPLENYNRKEEHVEKSSEESNVYNRFKNNDSVTDSHIGDSFQNQDYHNDYEDHKVTNEVTDNDTSSTTGRVEVTDSDGSSITTNENTDDKTVSSIKDGATTEQQKEDKTSNTASGTYVDVVGGQYTNEHSGGVTGTVGKDGSMSFSEGNDNRSTEQLVSAFNDTDYAPSNKSIVSGDIGTEGKNTSQTHTYGDAADNEITEDNTINKDGSYKELNSASEIVKGNSEEHNVNANDETVTTNEINSAKDDTVKDFTDDTHGENSNNTQTTANDKYLNNSSGVHTGDSQQTNSSDRTTQQDAYVHGNIGVTTSQAMLEAEIKINLLNLYDTMSELFADDNLITIYLKGGCCIW